MASESAPLSTQTTPVEISSGNRLAPLHAHLKRHFHFPDLAALELVLCSVVSHYCSPTDPVWLFVQGRSRSGKSVVAINPLVGLPLTHEVGDITPKTLISGFNKIVENKDGSKSRINSSLLYQIGKSGILLFKDFTTIMSKRPDQRAEIISQFRELHDGRWSKASGMTKTETWQGKVTIIAATTPAIERDWLLYRDLGERFLTVRWEARAENDHQSTLAAMNQEGDEPAIANKTRDLIHKVIDQPSLTNGPLPPIPLGMQERLSAFAKITSLARARVIRDSFAPRPIIDVPEPEVPTGIAKGLAALVRARPRLHRRPGGVTVEDLDLVSKIALDSIPTSRARLLSGLPAEGDRELSEIARITGIAKSSCDWHLDELAALGVTQKITTIADNICWGFTDDFRQLWHKAAFPKRTP